MNVEPNDLVHFARAVDEGSFSRAADRLGFPKSTLSRRVSALEAQLGEQLLRRTTRKLTATDFGHAVLDHAHHVVEDVAAEESLAQHRQVQPSGRLRVSCDFVTWRWRRKPQHDLPASPCCRSRPPTSCSTRPCATWALPTTSPATRPRSSRSDESA